MSFDLPGVEPGSDNETLFKAVGFVVVQWGFAEQSLDLMVASVFHAFDGHPSLPKRRPQFLEPKVELLEKCFSEIAELAPFRTEGEALLPRFSAAGKKRNELVHGAISDISIEDDSFRLVKLPGDAEATANGWIPSALKRQRERVILGDLPGKRW